MFGLYSRIRLLINFHFTQSFHFLGILKLGKRLGLFFWQLESAKHLLMCLSRLLHELVVASQRGYGLVVSPTNVVVMIFHQLNA